MTIDQTQETDGDRVRRLMDAWMQRTGLSQKAFASQTKMPGGSSMIGQHKSNHRPISLQHARAYMNGLGCKLSDLSPALAERVGNIESLSHTDSSGRQVEDVKAPWSKATPIKAAPPSLGQSVEVLALHLNQIPPQDKDAARALLSALVGSPGLHANITSGLQQLCEHHTANREAA